MATPNTTILSMNDFNCKEANRFSNFNGQYNYIKVLGQGVFGKVFRATRTEGSIQEDVAIKIIRVSKPLWDIVRRTRTYGLDDAKEEVGKLSRLTHDNVVQMSTHFRFKEGIIGMKRGLAIVMEYCPNGNLQTYLESMTTPIGLDQRKKWYTQLASAVQYIHSQSIVHMDIKPDNVMIMENMNLKLADVGLATQFLEKIDAQNGEEELTKSPYLCEYLTEVKGTKPYVAPEVLDKHYNKRCDTFSLGLIFVMIARDPSQDSDLSKDSDRHCCEPLTKLDKHLGATLQYTICSEPTSLLKISFDHLPREEVALFDGMLNQSYRDRYSSDNILKAIEEINAKSFTPPIPERTYMKVAKQPL